MDARSLCVRAVVAPAVAVAVLVAAVAVAVLVAGVVVLFVTVACAGLREEDVDGRRSDSAVHRLADLVPNRKAVFDRRQDRGIAAGRDQRGADHVAGRAGSAVEDERSHVTTDALHE